MTTIPTSSRANHSHKVGTQTSSLAGGHGHTVDVTALEAKDADLQGQITTLAARVTALEGPVVLPPATGPTVPDGLASGAITLQQAVNNAAAGSTFGVPPRTYLETVTIGKPLTLVAAGGLAVIEGGMSRPYGLVIGADDVTLDAITGAGWRVFNHKTPVQDGAIRVIGRQRTILRHVRSDHNGPNLVAKDGGAGITTQGATDFLAEDCEFDNNAQQGYHGSGGNNRVTYRRCKVHHNNPKGLTDGLWEAGAGKITHSTAILFEDCEVYDNVGVGVWSDIAADNWTVRRCKVYRNTLSGIMFEISTGAVIEDNALWHNGEKDSRGWGWPAQILVSSSTGPVEVRRNTMAWSLRGISVITQNRSDRPAGSGSNIHLAGNVAASTGGTVANWYDDWGGGFAGKTDDGGTYYASQSAARDAALVAAGIPLVP